MRSRALKTITLTLSAFALLAACTPEGERAVLNSSGAAQASEMEVGGSGAGNYLAGRHAQKERDFSSASRLLEKALEESPGNTRLLNRTFLTKLADGDIASAAEMARKITGTDARSASAPIAQLVLVVEAIRQGDLAGAETALEAFPDRGFSGFMKPLLQAWVLVGQGRGEDAIAALEPLKNQSGLRVLYELHAALVSDVAGMSVAAERHYRLAGENATQATLRGDADGARALYEAYTRENPDSVVLNPAMERLAAGVKPPFLVANAAEGVSEALFNIASTMTRQNSAQLALIYGRLSIYLKPDFDLAQMLDLSGGQSGISA